MIQVRTTVTLSCDACPGLGIKTTVTQDVDAAINPAMLEDLLPNGWRNVRGRHICPDHTYAWDDAAGDYVIIGYASGLADSLPQPLLGAVS